MSDLPPGYTLKSAAAEDLPPGYTVKRVPEESVLNQGLRAAATAGVRGLGGALDFMMDPLAPVRQIVSPSLNRIEQTGELLRPGAAAGDAFFDATGIREMQPESTWGRIGLGAATGAVGGGPFGLVPAILSGAGGALGQGVMETGGYLGVSPDNTERLATIAGLAPAFAAPLVRGPVNYAARQAREAFGPAFSEKYREGLVGNELRASTSDADALARSLLEPRVPELVPGSKPTLYQYTGDEGIGQFERAQRLVANPGQPPESAKFIARMNEQSQKRVEALRSVAPEGAAPGAVRDLLQQRLARLDTEGEVNIKAATQNAMQAMEQAGGRLNPEDYGALIRDQLEAAKAETKKSASTLWKAIDPDKTLTIDGSPVKQKATKIVADISKMARQPEGAEAEIFTNARMLGAASPFSDFSALRGSLLQAIREERINGETPALRRMQMLRSAVDDAISDAAENTAKSDPGLFGRVTAKLEQVGEGVGVEAATQAGGNNQTSALGSPGGGPPPVGGYPGAVGQATGRPGGIAGPQGVPGELPPVANFDQAASVRYRAAADAWRDMKDRFNNQIVGPALAERGNEYRMIESRVPERFIASPEGVQAFMDAGGTPATLKDALVGDLRRTALAPDGSLNVAKYQTWLNRRAAALRAFPDTEQTLGNVARAQETVDTVSASARQQKLDFERSAARHFLNAEPVQAVQSALGGKNPVGDMTQLVTLAKTDPAAMAGLQRSVAEHIERNFIGNADAMKSDAFQTFINRSSPALSQVFSPEQMQSMRNIAADLKRSNMSIAGSKIPGQSNTMQDAMLSKGRLSVLGSHAGPVAWGAISGLASLAIPGAGIVSAIEAAVGGGAVKRALDGLKATGLNKLDALRTEALLNPDVAAALLMKATPANRPFIAAKLRNALGRIIGASAADDNLKERPAATR